MLTYILFAEESRLQFFKIKLKISKDFTRFFMYAVGKISVIVKIFFHFIYANEFIGFPSLNFIDMSDFLIVTGAFNLKTLFLPSKF